MLGDTYNMGIGQGFLAATPIQMVRVVGCRRQRRHAADAARRARSARREGATSSCRNDPKIEAASAVSPENFAIIREAMRQAVTLGHRKGRRGRRRRGRRQDGHRRVRPALRRRHLRDARLVQRLRSGRRRRRSPSPSSSSAASARRTPRRWRRRFSTTTSTARSPRRTARSAPTRGDAVNLRNTPTREFDLPAARGAVGLVVYGALLIYSGSLTTYGSPGQALSHPVSRQIGFAASARRDDRPLALDYRVFGPLSLSAVHRLARRARLSCSSAGAASTARAAGSNLPGRRSSRRRSRRSRPSSCSRSTSPTTKRRSARCSVFVTSLAIAAAPAVLVLVEPDLGSAMVFGVLWLGMVVIAGARRASRAACSARRRRSCRWPSRQLAHGYQRERIDIWLDPEKDPTGHGLQHPPGGGRASARADCSGKASRTARRRSSTICAPRRRTTSSASAPRNSASSAPWCCSALFMLAAVPLPARRRPRRRHVRAPDRRRRHDVHPVPGVCEHRREHQTGAGDGRAAAAGQPGRQLAGHGAGVAGDIAEHPWAST